jgi:hypothetical protein
MKNFFCYPFLAMLLLLLCTLFGLGAVKQACDSHTRISEPPVKITDPNDIKNRPDICGGYYVKQVKSWTLAVQVYTSDR